MTFPASYDAQIGSQTVALPVIPLGDPPEKAICLLMTIDHGVAFIETAGRELADLFRDEGIEAVATAATLGIPVAIEVARALGIDDYLVLQKSNKVHLGDALAADLSSITSHGSQRLLLDRRRLGAVAGRRTLFIDDVISTGGSALASLRLLREAGAEIVGAGFLLEEEGPGRAAIEAEGVAVRTLGRIPILTA
ncbi:phosphoribosyltransferase family protein [Microbacterium sp. gxy059]|uniref:phosphoribosyltransferase family protein n=1 Tax=Microbacterium sp. gxy059 TaxID=2957199 RepID=UPI003D96FE4B